MAQPLIVGQFNDSYRPIMDGVGVCAENYARWISARHGTGIAVVPREPGFSDDDEFEVIRFLSVPFVFMKPYRLGVPWASRAEMRRLREIRFDLVHSHTPFVGGRLGRRVAQYHRVPHVSTFHTKYRDDALKIFGKERIADLVVRRIVAFYGTVDAVWTPSDATAATLREYGYEGAITVAPNGSDMPMPTPEEHENLRRRGEELCGLRSDEFMLLFVGQHRWEKNVRLIIEALGQMRRAERDGMVIPPYRMVFAGEGYAAAAMRSLCDDLGVRERTVFLGKIVDRRALQSLYARANLFVFPSVYDNAPLVMREAAAFSVPTIVAVGSTAAELIRDGENGFVTENSPDALARRLRLLVGQRPLVERVGRGAARTIFLSWSDIVDWAVTQYRAILDRFV